MMLASLALGRTRSPASRACIRKEVDLMMLASLTLG